MYIFSFSSADACRPREKFFREFPITTNRSKSLETFTIECTAQPTVFEVRYNNKQLCACGRITKVATEKYDKCIEKLPLNFTVVISTEKIHSQRGDNCTLRFTFKDQFVLIAKLGIFPGTFITSSYVIAKTVTRTSVVTRLFTSYITSTIILNGTVEIGQPSATSSAMVSQSEIGNSTTSSGQIRLVKTDLVRTDIICLRKKIGEHFQLFTHTLWENLKKSLYHSY